MERREEGECSDAHDDSFDVAYKPVSRPDSTKYRYAARELPSSDTDGSSGSDSDSPATTKRRRPNLGPMDICGPQSGDPRVWSVDSAARQPSRPRRRNNVWSTVMEEQVLSQEIGGFGLKRRLDQGERSVESYDYTQALKARGIKPPDSDTEEEEDEEEEEEEEVEEDKEDEEVKVKRLNRKRHIRERISYKKTRSKGGGGGQRNLADLAVGVESSTDEELGRAIAAGLMERKPELIIRVVSVVGRDRAQELYKETQELERNGGLLVLDGSRRRTSGGVYLQLVKSLPSLGKAELQRIFPQEESRSSQQWRKRKRAHRRRERHESKPQGEDAREEELQLGGVLSDDPGGAKCPGSTPVTSPRPSDNEDDPGPLINQLSPSGLPDLISISKPPVLADPRACKPDSTLDTFNGGFLNVGTDVQEVKEDDRTVEAYDEDFLDIHTNEEMELF
ncbi:phosphorylated adapter RNA export protein [Cherax quadricarinatus]|nr:phosphorylated adapter RNA export protein-like [Cherax quadricarinatus]